MMRLKTSSTPGVALLFGAMILSAPLIQGCATKTFVREQVGVVDTKLQGTDAQVKTAQGQIAAEGSPAELIRDYSTREVVELRFAPEEQDAMGEKLTDLATRLEVLPDRLLLYTDDGDAALAFVHQRVGNPRSALVRGPAAGAIRAASTASYSRRTAGRSSAFSPWAQ
jgi:hypothetical protein